MATFFYFFFFLSSSQNNATKQAVTVGMVLLSETSVMQDGNGEVMNGNLQAQK